METLKIGNKAIEGLLQLIGPGDLGPTVKTGKGQSLHRSAEPEERHLRTIFGEHMFRRYVYSRGSKRKTELRPIDSRLGLSPRIGSYLFEEFSQLFCIETAFGQAAVNLQTVFGQKLSVNTLESISHTMGVDAKTYIEQVPKPPAKEKSQLLVASLDAKGVPLIQAEPLKVKAFETRKQRPGKRRECSTQRRANANRLHAGGC